MKFDPNETLSRIKNDKILTPEAGHGSEVDILFKLGTKYTSQITDTRTNYTQSFHDLWVYYMHTCVYCVLRMNYATTKKPRKTNQLANKVLNCIQRVLGNPLKLSFFMRQRLKIIIVLERKI